MANLTSKELTALDQINYEQVLDKNIVMAQLCNDSKIKSDLENIAPHQQHANTLMTFLQ